ncbi:hypothetical protein ACRRTK_000305 [Alexandromys fortis]
MEKLLKGMEVRLSCGDAREDGGNSALTACARFVSRGARVLTADCTPEGQAFMNLWRSHLCWLNFPV